MSFHDAAALDRIYTHCSQAIAEAGRDREALFLARLALLLFERLGDEHACQQAIDDALHALPKPSLSAP